MTDGVTMRTNKHSTVKKVKALELKHLSSTKVDLEICTVQKAPRARSFTNSVQWSCRTINENKHGTWTRDEGCRKIFHILVKVNCECSVDLFQHSIKRSSISYSSADRLLQIEGTAGVGTIMLLA